MVGRPRPLPRRRLQIRFEHRFRAPLPYVFLWCTDYAPDDPGIEQAPYTRRILRREAGTVVYEDLGDRGNGWFLNRQTVALHPPDRWHAESDGTHRSWSIDYTLNAFPDGTTGLRIRGIRQATALDPEPPTAAAVLRNLEVMWSRFGRALERDYRRSARTAVRPSARAGRTRRRPAR